MFFGDNTAGYLFPYGGCHHAWALLGIVFCEDIKDSCLFFKISAFFFLLKVAFKFDIIFINLTSTD